MLIEVAGIDGSGKTTLIHAARKRINELGQAYAYERPFQSEGVRLLEAAASRAGRCRPYKVFGHSTVEAVRAVDLVARSALLHMYKGSNVQHAFCDGYVVEQLGRFRQFGLATAQNLEILKFATQPDILIYLRLPAEQAIERMRGRPKGDSLLLEDDPLAATQKVISALEEVIADLGSGVIALDATQSPDRLLTEVMQIIERSQHGA
ncbi:hypothetical protein NU688_10120 [Variovorax sp. ZS18.2.2]|uniref:hypothetical protein n=1 Tax=Variovorax sp. ZS18.2.2 TaxID=2971255 RepID=UPI0021517230|nr:hypothetical protein [Variovorax sp. ZS18.2.2]MCR6476511.1 hypothetical protein [Variovorax sp. ZS18.2.2]